jgi:integrase
MTEAGMKFKRSVISSFNQYIMLFYEEEYKTFRNYVTKNIVVPKTGFVHKKEPLTPDEYEKLCKYLEEKEMWRELAYIKFSYSTGCRREEARQLLKEVVNYEPQKKIVKIRDENGKECEMEAIAYRTHDIRCKGRGEIGKVRKLQYGEDAMDALKKWIEIRGEDDNPYVFVKKSKDGSVCEQLGESAFNYWCHHIFEPVIGRRIHPHLFRESKATNMVVYEKKSIEVAQKLLGHNSSETTKIYVISNEESDAFDAFV